MVLDASPSALHKTSMASMHWDHMYGLHKSVLHCQSYLRCKKKKRRRITMRYHSIITHLIIQNLLNYIKHNCIDIVKKLEWKFTRILKIYKNPSPFVLSIKIFHNAAFIVKKKKEENGITHAKCLKLHRPSQIWQNILDSNDVSLVSKYKYRNCIFKWLPSINKSYITKVYHQQS